MIAADEGVMPQTREHLAILDLLGVERGVVALTKSDLVDVDWLDLVEAEVEDLIGETTLRGSPVVRCSALTGDGLDELKATLAARLAETEQRRDRERSVPTGFAAREILGRVRASLLRRRDALRRGERPNSRS